MDIKIEYSEDSIFGDVDPEGENINVSASIDKYNAMVIKAVKREYKRSGVEIWCGSSARVTVDGRAESYDAQRVADIESGVWSDWKWVVHNKRGK